MKPGMILVAVLAAMPMAVAGQSNAPSISAQAVPAGFYSGARSEEVLAVQVLLDRSRHSPGVIDGVMGGNTKRAIAAFEAANGLEADGRIDPELLGKLKEAHPGVILERYTITQEDAGGPFLAIPDGMTEMAKLDRLAFENPAEALAEKFHMSRSFLEALNPGVDFGNAGTEITVVAKREPQEWESVARIEIDKTASELRAFAESGDLVATFPATVGSGEFPSPDGSMEVRAIAPAPAYYFDPSGRSWGPDEKLTIAPGPNNPVGSTWIDLSKEGYGIHGTPDPQLIGKSSSHGCVRLTNWDAEQLATLVNKGTAVVFL